MDAAQNRTSLMFGVPGIVLQIVGALMGRDIIPGGETVGLIVQIAGTILLIVGLSFYARAKGRHPAWGLLGLLSIIGLIVLAVLPDRRK